MFIDGSHRYKGVSTDYFALESQGDLFMFHDINSDQFVEDTMKFFNELAALPQFECRKFIDNYPTGRVGFGIGVCVRRVFMSGLVQGGVTATLPVAAGTGGVTATPGSTASTAAPSTGVYVCMCVYVLVCMCMRCAACVV